MVASLKLAALDTAEPCGPDLEYDPVFLELQILARGKAEQQFGDTLVAAEEPNWKAVFECCETLNSRTRDLRVFVLQTRAMTRLQGVAGTAAGFATIRSIVSELWDHVHPKLDADDDNDPTMRLNALAALIDNSTGLKELKSANWITATGVPCTVRQALAALALTEASEREAAISATELQAMVIAAAASDKFNSAAEALAQIAGLSTLLNQKVGSQLAPDFRPLVNLLKPLADYFERVTAGADVQIEQANEGQAMTAAPGTNPRPAGGSIRSRADAALLLEQVCKYLEVNEPSNPAPLLIRRAQRLLTMNFLDIVKDIAPDALANVETIAGTARNNASDD